MRNQDEYELILETILAMGEPRNADSTYSLLLHHY